MPSLNTIRTLILRYQSEGAEKARADANAVADAQQRVGQVATQAGNSTASAAERAAAVTEASTRRQLSGLKAYENELARIDRTVRQQQQLDRSSKIIDRAFNQGLIDEQERVRALSLSQARYNPEANDNRPAANGGLSSYDRMFVRYQGFDAASQLYSGASPSIVAVQQGSQVLQQLADREGGLSAGLKQLGVTAAGLVTPFTVAGTAVAATGVAFAAAAASASRDQEVLEKATRGIGAATGATAGQLDLLAKANAEAGKVSVSTAREIAAGYASTGQIALPLFDTLISRTNDYARLTGQDVPAATAELASMFADPAKGADDLASKIGGLDDRTRQLIQTQQEQGDRTAAQETLAAALKAQIDANAAATTGWAAAWNTVSGAADRAWESLKRAAGAATGLAPESAQSTVDRLNKQIENTNRLRTALGQDPLGLGSEAVRQRDAAQLIADTQAREARARATEEAANRASVKAGDIASTLDPQSAQYRELVGKRNALQAALDDPLARSKLFDVDQVQQARDAYARAVDTMVDANGRLISSGERARMQDQLRADAMKATTDAEKAAVAERQKAFDLAGKALTPLDAGAQITRAGQLSQIEAASKASGGGSRGEASDDYDRAVRSLEDRIRRQQQEAATIGMGAEAVARYRAETDLLTAAKRAERDITPELSAQIKGYADKAAEAASRQESLRESLRSMDDIRGTSRSVFSSFGSDLARGTGFADAFTNALSRVEQKIIDLAANNLTDALFGKTGSSSSGILGSLFSSFTGGLGGDSPTGGVRLFANGGIMTSAGEIPLNRYANGGVANSPQMALFGEGRLPEAYVPLPDGRRIPVAMQAPAPANTNVSLSAVVNERPGGDRAQVRQERDAQGNPRLIIDMLDRGIAQRGRQSAVARAATAPLRG